MEINKITNDDFVIDSDYKRHYIKPNIIKNIGNVMTTEEKARAYDEALALMEDCVPDKDGYVCVRPCDIFPELAESEDERIRKAQLDYWRSVGGKECHGVPVQKVIAWLEKQGEKTQVDNFDVKLKESKDERIRKELIEHIKANYDSDFILFQKFSPDDIIAWLEKQGEQMSVLDELEMTLSVSEDAYLRSNIEKLIKELKKGNNNERI